MDTVETALKRCWKHDCVVESGTKWIFKNIDYELLVRAVEKHIAEPWVKLYIRRELKVRFADRDRRRTERMAGTPQEE